MTTQFPISLERTGAKAAERPALDHAHLAAAVQRTLEAVDLPADGAMSVDLDYLPLRSAWERLLACHKTPLDTNPAEWPESDASISVQFAALEAYLVSHHCRSSLLRFFKRKMSDWYGAEALTQDVTWEGIETLRKGWKPTRRFLGWLFHLAHYRLKDSRRRSARRQRRLTSINDVPPQIARTPAADAQLNYQMMLDLLCERGGREVLIACQQAVEGYTREESAAACGVNERTIRRRMDLGREILKPLLR